MASWNGNIARLESNLLIDHDHAHITTQHLLPLAIMKQHRLPPIFELGTAANKDGPYKLPAEQPGVVVAFFIVRGCNNGDTHHVVHTRSNT